MKERGPKAPRPDSPQADLERRFSKTVLHAARRNRKSLFEKLTAENPFAVETLMDAPTRFAEYDRSAEASVQLDESIEGSLPKAFFNDPTKWIEAQPILKRSDLLQVRAKNGPTNKDLWREPYDATRVRSFDVRTPQQKRIGIISKRINGKSDTEVSRAREAYERGIPTPKVLAEISDKGNSYAWFERIEGYNLVEAKRMAEAFTPLPFYEDLTLSDLGDVSLLAPETVTRLTELLERSAGERIANSLLHTNEQEHEVLHAPRNEHISRYAKRFASHVANDLGVLEVRAPHQYDLLAKDLSNLHTSLAKDPDWIKEEGHRVWLRIHLERINDELKRWKSKFNETWESILRQDPKLNVLISGINKEMERLKQLCEEKGIQHKDFNERNLLVAWDRKANEPIMDQGHPRLYVLDWE